MATTGIWKVETRLDHVIDYTTNVEKTINDEYEDNDYLGLHNVIDYTTSDYKTEKQFYVSGINCSVDTAYEEMLITKKSFNKTKGILGFHAFQSFKEGEVTPELAHKIGVSLAEEMWGDRFEVVVSTHLNTKHFHNHFVINSISFKDGKRFYDKRETYAELRRISDVICDEYGLSVLKEKPCRNSKINYSNYYQGNNDKVNYYTIAKNDLDRAIGMAYSYNDFEQLMRAMDYELTYRAGKLSIRREPYKRNIRVARFFGDEYSIDNITERISTSEAIRIPFIEEYGIKKVNYHKEYKKAKSKGFYALCMHYCFLLKVFPSKHPYKRLPAAIRADIKELDRISLGTELLVKNKIETNQDFILFKNNKEKELDILLNEKSKLWYKHKKSISEDEKNKIKSQIELINQSLIPLRDEVKLCDEIEERIPKIKSNLKELYEDERKEVDKNEHIR